MPVRKLIYLFKLNDRVCQSQDKLLDKRGLYIICTKDETVLFVGECISEENLERFEAKAL